MCFDAQTTSKTWIYVEEKQMKRVLQFVAFAVIGLMAVQPLLGAPPCASAVPAPCTAGCPMADAAPDCPMAQSSMVGCSSGCCELSNPRTAAAVAVLIKPKAAMVDTPVPAAVKVVQTSAVRASRLLRSAPETGPPLYKLFRVFRI